MESRAHSVVVKERKFVSVNGVKHVDSYDDEKIFLQTNMGNLLLKGEELKIKGLDLDEGKLEVDGYVESITYTEEQGAKRKNILKRILK